MKLISEVALVIVILACLGAGYFWLRRPPPPASPPANSTRTSTGTLGKYQFESREDIAAFNDEIRAWLSKRGFAPYSDSTYAVIVGQDEWKMAGVLLRNHFDATNQIFVFIPDCYSTNNNRQIIGFHLALQGSSDMVRKRVSDFEKVTEEFQTLFPSTWEHNPEKG